MFCFLCHIIRHQVKPVLKDNQVERKSRNSELANDSKSLKDLLCILTACLLQRKQVIELLIGTGIHIKNLLCFYHRCNKLTGINRKFLQAGQKVCPIDNFSIIFVLWVNKLRLLRIGFELIMSALSHWLRETIV